MSDSNAENKGLTNPVDSIGYDSDGDFGESHGLLPEQNRSDNNIEGKLLKDWEGFMQLIKANIGAGMLGMPFAMKNAGIAIGPPLIILICLLIGHCMIILSSSSQIISKNAKLSSADYGMTAELSTIRIFPNKAHHFRRFVNCLIPIMQYSFCSVYVLFVAESLKQIIGHFDTKIWCLLLMPIFIILSYIYSLEIISYISSVGNICLVTSLIIIYQELFRNFQHSERLTLIGTSVPTAFGVIIYSIEGICTVLALENRMKKPENFNKVIWSSQAFITLCYLLTAIGGYLHYGDHSMGSIIFNFPKTPLYLAVRGLYAICVSAAYPTQFHIPTKLFFKYLRSDVLTDASEIKLISLELAYRTVLVLATGALAIAVPKLGLFIALIGATSGCFASIIIPAVIEIGTYYSYCSKVPKWLIIKDVIIIIIGILFFITGTYRTVYDLILAFNGHSVHHQSFNNITRN